MDRFRNWKYTLVFLLLLPTACTRQGSSLPSDSEQSTSPQSVEVSIQEQYLTTLNLGQAQFEEGAGQEAADAFQSAVNLLPGEPAARLNLARACLAAHQESETIRQAEIVLASDRHATAAHYLAGIAHLRRQETSQAISHLEAAARQDPSSPTVHFQLALALKENGQIDRFVEELRTVVSLDDSYWSAHYQLAQAARNRNDLESAQRHMERFQELRAQTPSTSSAPPGIDALETCKYTEIDIPAQIHQPSPEPIAVAFQPDAESTFATLPKGTRPLAVTHVDEAGRAVTLCLSPSGTLLQVVPSEPTPQVVHADSLFSQNEPVRACTGDADNDGRPEVFAYSPSRAVLLSEADDGRFHDITADAGLPGTGLRAAIWIDYDHDADLDLLSLSADGTTLRLWGNTGNRRFDDHTEDAELPQPDAPGHALVASDINSDEATDIVVTVEDSSPWFLKNDGLGFFSLAEPGSAWPQTLLAIVEDLDHDLLPDLLGATAESFRVAGSSGSTMEATQLSGAISEMLSIDYDNDGWLDLALAVAVSPESPEATAPRSLRLYRNAGAGGWHDVTAACGLDSATIHDRSPLLAADFDNDGDTDLLFTGAGDAMQLWRNDGGDRHQMLKLQLVGTKSNKSGLGTLVEIRSGSFRLARTVRQFPVEIGVGDLTQLDSVRTIWPNGIVKNDIWVPTDQPLRVEEPFVSAGSCPYLYAWDGSDFRFVTDILGGAPLGLSLRRGEFVPANPQEYLYLGNQRDFLPRTGNYVVRITDELREILYLDTTRLLWVDHPLGTEVHPADKLRPPPFEPSSLWLLGRRSALIRATDSEGIERTSELREIDAARVRPPKLRPPQLRGLAHRHAYTLDFGPLDTGKPLMLAMTGWLMWGDASVNIAASQNPDLPNPWPRLEARVGDSWHPIDVIVGAPSGKTKTILVDLDGRLPPGTRELRLSAAFEIYWDRIALFEKLNDTPLRPSVIEPASAQLSWRGFPSQVRPDPNGPIVPDPSNLRTTPPWNSTPVGWCTRYGDVLELLIETDNRLVILNGGDAAEIEFPSPSSNPPGGSTRSFFLHCEGWDKDSDYHVKHGNTVEPLPFHGMNAQAYGVQPPPPPVDDWWQRFTTRWTRPHP